MRPAIVSIAAKSGTGKTTLVVKLIAELKQRGYKVGAIKHDAHNFSMDREGKDSWRFTQAGADTMMVTSKEKLAIIKQNPDQQEPPVRESITRYFGDMDIVITEGFKKNDFPKIEVHRKERSPRLLYRDDSYDSTLIAVASDSPLQLDVPVFELDDALSICDFIEERFLSDRRKQ
ncbi:molybdopterin-guanine dinucleotide biosynthesis protein MobB [Syntrophotalea carbinolica DSM 2380]|uniref:Molybdopterin-guanine dinucleotide biosynthesis protein MobB n=1 Tax=Syntrophotalea carbinolica (strain DSM 2380 / NBRC 103641 / GraBd1) TaxID=338963 RepID=Q3A0X6_SYNC1|nr:molybdopterin-guanine dinucleotide biosynthesis protein B [Syntrophotalea carbinolica]ABA89981.1 molybdopterin-guanine dinucleotide biosynthesis protein MobB [Syntrophotalea carbinolica DSM 2380]